MKKNTKKKLFTLMLVIMLLSIAVVGGSLAWFTDEDEVTNTFTVGSVVIKQHEDFDKEGAELLIPVVGNNPTRTSDNYIKKIVTVENTGKNPAYIQTLVAVPAPLDEAGIVKLWDNNYHRYHWIKLNGGRPVFEDVKIDGEEMPYNVYVYRYNTALAKDATTGPCLEWVYIDSQTDMKVTVNEDGEAIRGYFTIPDQNGEPIEVKDFDPIQDKLNIYVMTQAVQAEGFYNAQSAFQSAFGNNTPVFNASHAISTQ